MQRYFVDVDNVDMHQNILINADDSHHLIRVMRQKIGANLYLVTLDEKLFKAKIVNITENHQVEVEVFEGIDQQVELPVHVTIACGLSKNDKIDTIVQKATECGMTDFIPLALNRDTVKWPAKKVDQRINRLSKIAKEAAEQSHRLKVPHIHELMTLDDLLKQRDNYNHALVAYEEVAKDNQHGQLYQSFQAMQNNDKVLIVFGSEGGLEEKEISILSNYQFKACSLGPRILRAETAPIYFLSALSYHLELSK